MIPQDVVVKDGDVIRLGDNSFGVLETPGHTAGTLSYTFDVKDGGSTYRAVTIGGLGLNAIKNSKQLTRVANGQPVDITVDMFPGSSLRGRVTRLSPASGSTFALLPPDNATGNFTKVVQRIPVRIEFESGQSLVGQLRPGMSVVTRIRVKGSAQTIAQAEASHVR